MSIPPKASDHSAVSTAPTSEIPKAAEASSLKMLAEAVRKYYWSRLQRESDIFTSPYVPKSAVRDKVLKPSQIRLTTSIGQ